MVCKIFSLSIMLYTNKYDFSSKKNEKNILSVKKMVVFLQPFSARGYDDREREKFETDEKRERACVKPLYLGTRGTRRRVKKVNKEQFLQ